MLNANWSKAGGEERTEEYRTWRTQWGAGAVCDLDQIEYDARTGKPIALLELCVADMRSEQHPAGIVSVAAGPSPGFLKAVEAKLSRNRAQGRALRHIAAILSVPVILVVWIKGYLLAGGFWVKQLNHPGWQHLPAEHYQERLQAWIARAAVRSRRKPCRRCRRHPDQLVLFSLCEACQPPTGGVE